MKLVVINQKVTFARHWGKWYRVARSGEDWRKLEIGKKYEKEEKFDLDKVAEKLKKAGK